MLASHNHFSPSSSFPPPPSCLQVRCFRPWSLQHFMAVLPATASRICVLDRTKESGALAEPLYLDVIATLAEHEVSVGVRSEVDTQIWAKLQERDGDCALAAPHGLPTDFWPPE